MKHYMRLHPEPFDKIKNGTKTIEMRLYDEKRQLLKVGDLIEFTNRANSEKILTEVTNLYVFSSFSELYSHFDREILGYDMDEEANPKDLEIYYPKEEQEQYGVVAIEIKKV